MFGFLCGVPNLWGASPLWLRPLHIIFTVAWMRLPSGLDAPPANFHFDEGGRSRQERLYTVGGPSRSKESHVDMVAIASEPSWMHKHTAKWTNSQNYRLLAWRSPPNGDRRCSSHLSHHVRSMYEDKHCTAFPTPMSHVRIEAENA